MKARVGLVLVALLGCDGGGDPDAGMEPDSGRPIDAGPDLDVLDCEVVVIGGGAGGLHTAFRLAPDMGEGVCLFEKEAELGGRIHDEPRDPSDPDSPRWGTGALRVMEGQDVLFNLATELGITLELAPGQADLIHARGTFAYDKDDLAPRYGFTPIAMVDDQETALYELLLDNPMRPNVANFADFRSYVRAVVGGEGFAFLHDMSRFRADFEYPLDARGYMDYLDEEWNVCCDPSYPVGGMSEFIRGMEREARADGARIFTSEPVLEIRRNGDAYEVLTETHLANASRVVIAVPPVALDHIEGDVVEEIREQPEYQSIIAVRVATVTQWWNERWWDAIDASLDNQVWRAWTTEHCVNFVEIPLGAYGRDQMVTRSVYDDDLSCVQFWEETFAAGGVEAVEAEVQRGLEMLFVDNGLSPNPDPSPIPQPVRTHVQIWPAAWHWLRAGTTFTNAQIFDWALEPLAGEEVALVGEAYNVNRSGWSDGAYKSSINLLNMRYGMSLPITGSMPIRAVPLRAGRGGH